MSDVLEDFTGDVLVVLFSEVYERGSLFACCEFASCKWRGCLAILGKRRVCLCCMECGQMHFCKGTDCRFIYEYILVLEKAGVMGSGTIVAKCGKRWGGLSFFL